ncbi:hypothetical protein CL3_17680 [butyrate-producing bacterium SM4/1]|nr:hypothetical protein CL3_17680 [butyrate-producing bacterium SM4/1]
MQFFCSRKVTKKLHPFPTFIHFTLFPGERGEAAHHALLPSVFSPP